MLDTLIVTSLILFGCISYRIIRRHLEDDLVLLKGELEVLQLKTSLFSSKVAVLEQYIEEFWHSIPENEAENLEMLYHIREGLDRLLSEGRKCLKFRDIEGATEVVKKLRGQPSIITGDCALYQLVRWEERGRKVILRMCQQLTVEASLAKKAETARNYRRTPTLVSLREISELLREERGIRL